MNSSSQNPALPTWIFIVTDIALIGAAAVIALLSAHPLSTSAMLWIVACVGVGTIVGLVPLVVRYERQKNETLDERQRALEALARSVGGIAEQVSIAANGLHEIAELAHKNLRAAEQLPHKLQDKIAEFQAQLSAAADTEKEELERELLALRTSESERLESVSQRIAKSSAEWTKLEAATHQHLTAANEAVAKLAFGTAGAISKAQVAAEQALTQARVEAARTLGDTSGSAASAIESAKAAALAAIDARLAAASATLVERVLAELNAKLATTGTSIAATPTPAATSAETPSADVSAESDTSPPDRPATTPETPSVEAVASPAKRLRKTTRRDDAASNGAADNHEDSSPEPAAVIPPTVDHPAEEAPSSPAEEPLPVPANSIPEITPVAPPTAEPFSGNIAALPESTSTVAPEPPKTEAAAATPVDAAKPPRKRPAKKAESDDEPGLGLDLGDTPAALSNGTTERVLTSDGATRLLVTAYIGIGNRLFIRGNGPGLSWEKGVPLQFVSIGKWRWETNDAAAAVSFKLYKNDETACPGLGEQTLDPGHQHEVTAAF